MTISVLPCQTRMGQTDTSQKFQMVYKQKMMPKIPRLFPFYPQLKREGKAGEMVTSQMKAVLKRTVMAQMEL